MICLIIYSMTYEEYKNSKQDSNKKSVLKTIFNKIFTVAIFVLVIMIISNFSPDFKEFVTDKILNSTLDFSFVNKFTSNITDVFKTTSDDIPVISTNLESEKYLDGIKYNYSGDVLLKSSGIVTYIGEKEGYGNTVVVQQSNGYYAWYGNINESIKIYDYVEANSKIGVSDKEYYYVLLKDDVPIEINNEN